MQLIVVPVLVIGILLLEKKLHGLTGPSTRANPEKLRLKSTIKRMECQGEELDTPQTQALYNTQQEAIRALKDSLALMPDSLYSFSLLKVLVFLMPCALSLCFLSSSSALQIRGDSLFCPISQFLGTQQGQTFYFSLFSWYLLSLFVLKPTIPYIL